MAAFADGFLLGLDVFFLAGMAELYSQKAVVCSLKDSQKAHVTPRQRASRILQLE